MVVKILVLGIVGYAIVLALAWRFQERLAFPGALGILPDPSALGFPEGERISLRARDGATVTGWYLPPRDSAWGKPAPGFLWFHGNRENIEGIAPVIRALRPPAAGVVVIDYRGYGESRGRVSERGMYADGEAAWDYLAARPEIDSVRIAVYGRSIGSTVALHVATTRPAAAVILDSPFTSANDMARRHYPFFPRFLRRLRLDNVGLAAGLDVPLLILHGADDYIAPVEMGREVAAAGRATDLVIFEGAGHNDMYSWDLDRYREALTSFLSRLAEPRSLDTAKEPPAGAPDGADEDGSV